MKTMSMIAVACTMILCGPALAVDSIGRMSDVAEQPQIVSWNGPYLGGFVGAAAGGAVDAQEPFRLDNGAYWYRPFHSPYGYSLDPSIIGGLTAGYNLQIPRSPFVVGIEGEYSYLGVYGAGRDVNQLYYGAMVNSFAPNVSSHRTSIGNKYGYGFIGGRIGYAADRFLVYVKGGAIFTNIDTSFRAFKEEDNITPLPNLSLFSSVNKTGYSIGAGVEYALAAPPLQNVSIKVEYLYLGVYNRQSPFGYCSCGFHWTASDAIYGLHTAKIGLNYTFKEFSF